MMFFVVSIMLFGTGFDLNYFLSQKERKWSIQLLAFCCLYLAAKIDEVVVPRSVDMQVYYFSLMLTL
jgi:hypothetical protein